MNLCEHGKTESERKKYCQRPGPPYSASDFSEGDTKRGNDGNMYIINVSKKGVKQWKMRKNTELSDHPLDLKEELRDESEIILVHPFIEKCILKDDIFFDREIHKGDVIEFAVSELDKKKLIIENISPTEHGSTRVQIKYLADEKVKKEKKINVEGKDYPVSFKGSYALFTINLDDSIYFNILEKKSFIKSHQEYQNRRLSLFSESGVIFRQSKNRSLLSQLYQEINTFSDKKKLFYHPGSNNQILDIVHPSLYSYVKNFSQLNDIPLRKYIPPPEIKMSKKKKKKSNKKKTIRKKSLSKAGMWNRFKDFFKSTSKNNLEGGKRKNRSLQKENNTDFWNRPYEKSNYQMLPSEFEIDSSGKCVIKSYINNIPREEKKIYNLIERLFEDVLPDFEKMWSYITSIRLVDHDIYTIYDYPEDYCDLKLVPKSLKDKTLQVITKITKTRLDKNSIEGAWHVEGMSHENIVASAVCVLNQTSKFQADLKFRRRFSICEGEKITSSQRGRPNNYNDSFIFNYLSYFNDGHNDNPYQDMVPLGKISTKTGSVTVFPNSHIHKLDLSSSSSNEERTVIVFWLVNPESPIISTANVEAQQREKHWSPKIAKEHQLKFMEERKYYKQSFNVRSLNLCEH